MQPAVSQVTFPTQINQINDQIKKNYCHQNQKNMAEAGLWNFPYPHTIASLVFAIGKLNISDLKDGRLQRYTRVSIY